MTLSLSSWIPTMNEKGWRLPSWSRVWRMTAWWEMITKAKCYSHWGCSDFGRFRGRFSKDLLPLQVPSIRRKSCCSLNYSPHFVTQYCLQWGHWSAILYNRRPHNEPLQTEDAYAFVRAIVERCSWCHQSAIIDS